MSKSSFQEKLLERFCGKRPSNWKTIRLAEFFSERVERREPDASCPLYSFTIESGVTPKTDRYERSFLVKEDGEDSFKTVHPGDFVMNPMNLRWGAIGQSKIKAPVTVSGYYDVLIPKFNKGAGFLQSLLRSYQILSLYDIVATGSLLEKKRVHCSQFLDLCIYWPPEPELEKLSDILTTWDEALTQLDALIEAQERRKKALMQQLLTGRRRLKGFDQSKGKTASDRFGIYPADWKRVRLGEITHEVPTKNAQGTDLPVLSCTKHRGLVLSQEYFGKRVYAEDTSGYRVVQRGEFAYATNHIEEGSIGYQNLCDAGLVSPIYTVFKTTEAVDDSYLFRVLKSPLLIHFYQINTSASVDRRGSLRYDEFSRIHIWLPGKEEQTAIAQVFDTADQQLTLLRTQRTALDQQKRGLMQRLLTGKLRVKTTEPSHEQAQETQRR